MRVPARRLWLLLAACLVAASVATGTVQAAAGFAGPVTSGAGTDPSGSKPESKLWWNDGFWWGSLWDTASARFEIFKLDTSTQAWTSTDAAIDARSGSRADALWDGATGKLYVASHVYTQSPASGNPSNLYRYTYNAGTDTYTLDAGFPVAINDLSLETLVIDRDSTGKVWATWVQGGDVWVNRTLCAPTCDDAAWGTPFALPVAGAGNVKSDDISSVIAFAGTSVGVMWSNQSDKAMYFSRHLDADPDTTWAATETAYYSPGQSLADDHINLKMLSGVGGRVFAATKTSNSSGGQPLTALLTRDPVTGTWTNATFGTTTDKHTRPIVLLDDEHGVVHVFATSGSDDIVEKTSDIDSISFPSGTGTVVIDQGSGINNATSTKQNVNSTTGLVVVASGGGRYWHHWDALGAPPPPTGPDAQFSGTPTAGEAPLLVQFTDESTGSPTSWEWDFQDDGIVDSTDQNPSFTYTSPGTYAVELTVRDAQSRSDTLTKTSYVTVIEPGSALTFAPDADSYVRASSVSENNGTKTTLRVRGGSKLINTYLKFTVSGVSGPVTSAKLRLVVTDPSSSGGTIYPTSNGYAGSGTPWTETGITWSNAPAETGAALASAGAVATGAVVELDLGSAVTGNGTYSFLLKSSVSDLVDYSSRQGANPPQLVVTQQTGPDETPPTVTLRTPGVDATGVSMSASVTATFSEEVLGVDGTTFTLTGPGGPIAATVGYNPSTDTATLDPDADLLPLTTYTATLTGGPVAIRDPAGNPLATTSWSFTTADTPPPPSGSIELSGAPVSATIATGASLVLPSWTPSPDDLVLVAVSQRDESRAVSVAGNGLAWTEIANVDNAQGQGGVSLWLGQGPSPTAGSVTVTVTGNTKPVAVVAQRFSGVSPSTPVEALATAPGPGVDDNDLLASVSTATPGALAVAAAWHRGQTLSIPAGETSILGNVLAGSGGDSTRASLWYEGPVASPGPTQLGAADDLSAAGDWAAIVVALRPA